MTALLKKSSQNSHESAKVCFATFLAQSLYCVNLFIVFQKVKHHSSDNLQIMKMLKNEQNENEIRFSSWESEQQG